MDDAPMLQTDKGKPDTTARHVLQVLAEHASKTGTNARPSLMRIQYRSGYDRRTVQRALRRLEAAGLITPTGVISGCTVYRLSMGTTRPASDWKELEAEEARQRDVDAERQRRYRSRSRVTDANAVTVTDAESVTADERHALSVRTSRTQNPDVTDATPPEPSVEHVREPSLSSRVPQQPIEPPAPVERETVASTDKATTAQRIVRAAGVVSAEEEQEFIAWVRVKYPPAGPQFWRKVGDQGDLPELVEAWRNSQPSRPRFSLLPDWCGHCNRGIQPATIAERLTETTDGRIEPCRACHPKRQAAA
jgi:hypothetical protein